MKYVIGYKLEGVQSEPHGFVFEADTDEEAKEVADSQVALLRQQDGVTGFVHVTLENPSPDHQFSYTVYVERGARASFRTFFRRWKHD